MQPDVEKIVGEYLRDNPTVSALVGDRVGGRHPRSLEEPWVKVVQIGDSVIGNSPVHLVAVDLQLDCYGSADEYAAHGEASELSRAVRAVLAEMPEETFAGAVVSDVKFGPLSRIPDTDLEPARERFILSATVYCHAD